MRTLINLWILASFTDVFACLFLVFGFWRRSTSWVGLYWSVALVGITIESLLSLGSLLGGGAQEVSTEYATMRLIGRSVKALSLWMMAIRVLRTER